jgi:tRNA threonylcarbamoyladenosine biosynthesis protein TsaB
MRVGIASAQALAYALSLPLVGVDGLAAMAAAVPAATASHVDIVVPTIDARRSEVAWATHRVNSGGAPERADMTRVDAARVGSIEDLLVAIRERAQNCLLVGDFAHRHRDDITAALGVQSWTLAFGDDSLNWPHAKQVALLAHAQLLRSDAHESNSGVPTVAAMYLREADAEINWSQRSHA